MMPSMCWPSAETTTPPMLCSPSRSTSSAIVAVAEMVTTAGPFFLTMSSIFMLRRYALAPPG